MPHATQLGQVELNWLQPKLSSPCPRKDSSNISAPTTSPPGIQRSGWALFDLFVMRKYGPSQSHDGLSGTRRPVRVRALRRNHWPTWHLAAPGRQTSLGWANVWCAMEDRMVRVLWTEEYLKRRKKWGTGWGGWLHCHSGSWCLDLGSCWGPFLGPWPWCSHGFCWCLWLLLAPKAERIML